MRPIDIIQWILHDSKKFEMGDRGYAYAPTNIALIKYWGKRDNILNIPMGDSLSIALPEKGCFTDITFLSHPHDKIQINGKTLKRDSFAYQQLTHFLDNFRGPNFVHFHINFQINIPINAGVASSACSYASLVLALNDLYHWNLTVEELSILARLGSGSACRSLWSGFVKWSAGQDIHGMDSFATPLSQRWEDLRIGLLILTEKEKPVRSREAMRRVQKTSLFYSPWIRQNKDDLRHIRKSIEKHDFQRFGQLIESNALGMHATALTAWPPIAYSTPRTLSAIQKIWQARANGLPLYFTQDAGPNLKLFFLKDHTKVVQEIFPQLDLCIPFTQTKNEDEVILVNENDKAIGIADKLTAHKLGLRHRAFSIFIFFKNTDGKLELLLQQRHATKYHCANLWTNTCCSHPQPGETLLNAANRRLREEMGIKTSLYLKGKFHYIAPFENGLTENEIDYVFVGYAQNKRVKPHPEEVQAYDWIEINTLLKAMSKNRNKYTPWLEQALKIALMV